MSIDRHRRSAGACNRARRCVVNVMTLGILLAVITSRSGGQELPINSADLADPAAMARSMPRLARQIMSAYHDADQRDSLDAVFRLQMVAGQYGRAARSVRALRMLRTAGGSAVTAQDRATNMQYEIYITAKQIEAASGISFVAAFQHAFRETLRGLDDRTAAMVMREFSAGLPGIQASLQRAIAGQRGKSAITLRGALGLVRDYQIAQSYGSFAALSPALVAEDDQRRYIIDRDIAVNTPDGAIVCAMVVRQRLAPMRIPALLNFTVYADPVTTLNEARRTASNGYAGVEGLTRGKGCSPDKPDPYDHDGTDADAVIEWISKQPWSDGRVGMYGGSYEGFTQWAAAKRLPRALKALMPSVTEAPGVDTPMEGNVFQTFIYYWPFYTATNKTLDDAAYNDRGRWWRMQREWYITGQAYRNLDRIDGTPNPIFDRWLDHPSYDAFWQRLIPYRDDFARIDIPVLTTTGYYDGGQIGALYYLIQHYKYNPSARHYLVIGPYDHISGQRGTTSLLGDERKALDGYEIDPVAHIDMGELRYQWFDYVFRGAAKPSLLADRINYEVMGANTWRHAPSLNAMANQRLSFHLGSAVLPNGLYPLQSHSQSPATSVTQTIDLADRSDVDRMFSTAIVQRKLDTWNSIAFVSDPLMQPTELSGLFSGSLHFITNKRDFDFEISLYELTPAGDYVALSYYMARASYVRDRSHRRLLVPGRPQQLDFLSGRLTSRKFQVGSRLIVEISLIRQPGAQINYGTGRDVSDETIADAGSSLTIKWLGSSVINVPVRR